MSKSILPNFETTLHSEKNTQWSRRNLLRATGIGITAMAATRSWDVGAEMLRDHNRVSIETIQDDIAKEKFPHRMTLLYPGFKNTWSDSSKTALALQPATQNFGQLARVGFSNKGFDEDEIFDESIRHCRDNDIDTLQLIGESMSGILIANLTPRFADAGIGVKAGFLLNSPTGADDIIDREGFDWIIRCQKMGLTLPEGVRLYGEFKQRFDNMNERTFMQIIEQTMDQVSPTACSSALLQTSALYIDKGIRSINRGDTRFALLGNESDSVVRFESSVDNFRKILGQNFVYSPYLTGNAYHASASWKENRSIYCTQITNAAQDLQLLPRPKNTVKFF